MARFPECSTDDCKGTALWNPVAVIMSSSNCKPGVSPIKTTFDVSYCAICKTRTSIGDLVDDAGFERISAAIVDQGYSKPARNDMFIEWDGIEANRT